MRTALELIEQLSRRGDRYLTTYDRRGRQRSRYALAELAQRSLAAGAILRERGVAPGGYVFIQLANSAELVECFLGAIWEGIVPCCLAPPRALGGVDVFRDRLRVLLSTFAGGHLVTTPDVGDMADVPYFEAPDTGSSFAQFENFQRRVIDPESIAFVQLTSGSTHRPKAVKISHRALVANALGILQSGDTHSDESFVSWLPLYHDMGLVGMLFGSLFAEADLHLMRPETFLARPLTWLKIISDLPTRTLASAPDFAYRHCAQKIQDDDLESLDLSRWKIAGCGAERVRPETLDAFVDRFEAVGFRRQAFVPCYGLAEYTLAVTFGTGNRLPRVRDGRVSCGAVITDTEIVIRDESGAPLEDNVEGEITIRGRSLCSGYGGVEDTAALRDGWLYTGDRGFLADGELTVTGRLKDLIIVDGVNIDPEEIEAIGGRIVEIPGGRSGAFSVEVDRREQPVLIVEAIMRDEVNITRWAEGIGDLITSVFGFTLHDLVFIRRGSIPTTSSGKVKRAELKSLYTRGNLEIIRSTGSTEPVESKETNE